MHNNRYDSEFNSIVEDSLKNIVNDDSIQRDALRWIESVWRKGYAYNFTWLGVPVIKLPADLIVLQELIFKCKPTVVIETGIARAGSIIYTASLLKLINGGLSIGVDVDIREHAKKAIIDHQENLNIKVFEGSSTDEKVLAKIKECIRPEDRVMVILDSDHRKAHVSEEIKMYSDMVTKGQYLCITDTFIEYLPVGFFKGFGESSDDVGNSPVSAIQEWDYKKAGFKLDKIASRKAVISENYDGYFIKS